MQWMYELELELENSLFDTYKYASYMTRNMWSKKLHKYSRETKAKVHTYRYRQSHPIDGMYLWVHSFKIHVLYLYHLVIFVIDCEHVAEKICVFPHLSHILVTFR